MSAKYLMHLTIDTGHSRRSYRNEVDDAEIARTAQALAAVQPGGRYNIRRGYWLEPVAAGSALAGTVMSDAGHPVVTIAVAGKSRDSGKLWAELCETFGATGDAPPVPWCAVKMHPGTARHLLAMTWLGNYERVLAWAWLERRLMAPDN